VNKINRISNKERDLLKESVARQERITVLETKRRQVRNQKQYVRRQGSNASTAAGFAAHRSSSSTPDGRRVLPWKNIGLLSVGALAAGMLVFNYSK